mmetsp:Transcript_21262/g.33072  ORF Transcript_21262/g.33072 Transcript_21262/m.33072 type:complete len:95 (+) Transcript_21262:455-739(+)
MGHRESSTRRDPTASAATTAFTYFLQRKVGHDDDSPKAVTDVVFQINFQQKNTTKQKKRELEAEFRFLVQANPSPQASPWIPRHQKAILLSEQF